MKKPGILSYPLSAQLRVWSDCADTEADSSLRWAYRSFCWFCHAAALPNPECTHALDEILKSFNKKSFSGSKPRTAFVLCALCYCFPTLVWFQYILLFYFFSVAWIAAANEAIILTAIPKYAGFPDTHHIFMIPGTPYDLTKNETLYQYAVSYSSQPYARFQSCAVDYSRKVLYMYDKRYSEIVAISNLDTENGFDNSAITKLHVGVSRGDVKVAVDWVSHNIYWTDPMFRLIVMQPADADVTNSNLYKIIVKENLDRPYALAVDPVGG